MCVHFPPLLPMAFRLFVMRFVGQRKRKVSLPFYLPKGMVVVGHRPKKKGL